MKKAVVAILISIFCTTILFACNSRREILYDTLSLEDAYNVGWITLDQLKCVAYYYNNELQEADDLGFPLIPKADLDEEVEMKIKLSYLQQDYIKSAYPHATTLNICRFDYYGIYDGYVVVFILDSLFGYDLHYQPVKTIGGVSFNNYSSLTVYDTYSV